MVSCNSSFKIEKKLEKKCAKLNGDFQRYKVSLPGGYLSELPFYSLMADNYNYLKH